MATEALYLLDGLEVALLVTVLSKHRDKVVPEEELALTQRLVAYCKGERRCGK
jgi:hypothetical protein